MARNAWWNVNLAGQSVSLLTENSIVLTVFCLGYMMWMCLNKRHIKCAIWCTFLTPRVAIRFSIYRPRGKRYLMSMVLVTRFFCYSCDVVILKINVMFFCVAASREMLMRVLLFQLFSLSQQCALFSSRHVILYASLCATLFLQSLEDSCLFSLWMCNFQGCK